MSCFVRIATKLVDRDIVQQAAAELGHPVIAGTTEARGWSGRRERADFVLRTGTDYDIGAVRTAEGSYDFVADWSMTHVDQKTFVNRLTQKYSTLRVTQAAKKKGFNVAHQEVDAKGSVRLVLRRFA